MPYDCIIHVLKFINMYRLRKLDSNVQRVPKMSVAIKRIFIRTIKLMFWGILLQGESHLSLINFNKNNFQL